MIELHRDDYYLAEALFAPLLASQLFCAGVLAGKYEGQVFVDDKVNPQTGFVSKNVGWGFLAGNTDNAAFNQALHDAIFAKRIGGEKAWGLNLVCHPETWDAQIADLFAPQIPIKNERLHYHATAKSGDWRSQIPDDFEICFIDEGLAEKVAELPGAVDEVLKMRENVTEPDLNAIGYVALHNNRVVAYSVINCIVGTGGDIGLFTDDAFRRRGLAFLTSAAAIEYGLSHGLEIVHWNCRASNMGSVKTAEKLGLKLDHQHSMYTLILNPVIHDVNRAWYFVDEAQYEAAIAFCDDLIAQKDAHVHFYYVRALALLKIRQRDEAAGALLDAAEQGWDSPGELQSDFAALATHTLWTTILARVMANSEQA